MHHFFLKKNPTPPHSIPFQLNMFDITPAPPHPHPTPPHPIRFRFNSTCLILPQPHPPHPTPSPPHPFELSVVCGFDPDLCVDLIQICVWIWSWVCVDLIQICVWIWSLSQHDDQILWDTLGTKQNKLLCFSCTNSPASSLAVKMWLRSL